MVGISIMRQKFLKIYVGMGIEKVIILDNFVKLAADWTWEIHIHESAAKCEHGSRFDIEFSNAFSSASD